MNPDHGQRTAAPAHATGTVEFVSLADVADDDEFRLREPGDVSQLATSMGRLGQLAPVELRPWPSAGMEGPCWQMVAGFRRLAAVRMLARERVLARIHFELPDRDAWDLALGEALLEEPLTPEELESLRGRLRASGLAPWAEELIDEAMVRAPAVPEPREPEAGSPREEDAAPSLAPSSPKEEEAAPSLAPSSSKEEDAAPPLALSSSKGEGPDVAQAPEPPLIPSVGAQAPESRDPSALRQAQREREMEEIVEVTPEELVHDLSGRLYALSQDLVTAFEAWEDLPVDGRKLLIEQARYVAALLPFMEAKQ